VRCLELFAGAGGAALGLERAGIHHAALVEWQPSACATLRAAGLSPVVEGDVRDLDAIEAVAGRDVDLVWSSFPCQAWSTAGRRKGANDVRNGWPWTVAAVDRFRPRWFLGENVTGLLCHKGGCTYRGGQEGLFAAADPNACPGCYLERVILPDLRARFACSGWWVIDAADHGTPQHRRRVILWAGPVEPERPRETHGPGRPLPWVAMGEALGLGGFETHSQRSPETAKGGNRWIPGDEPSATISAISAPHIRAIGAGTNSHGPGRAHERTERDITDEPSPTITAEQIGNAGPWLSRPSPTVSAVGECKGSGPGGNPEKMQRASDALYLGTGRRRLTYLECATLQGFPADHPWQGTITERYRQVGNAVVPLVAELLGRAIIEADRVNP
jgi:DNA (cytosine-5)-methyltransferase 1